VKWTRSNVLNNFTKNRTREVGKQIVGRGENAINMKRNIRRKIAHGKYRSDK
jgi:hypothetical protein